MFTHAFTNFQYDEIFLENVSILYHTWQRSDQLGPDKIARQTSIAFFTHAHLKKTRWSYGIGE